MAYKIKSKKAKEKKTFVVENSKIPYKEWEFEIKDTGDRVIVEAENKVEAFASASKKAKRLSKDLKLKSVYGY